MGVSSWSSVNGSMLFLCLTDSGEFTIQEEVTQRTVITVLSLQNLNLCDAASNLLIQIYTVSIMLYSKQHSRSCGFQSKPHRSDMLRRYYTAHTLLLYIHELRTGRLVSCI